MTGGYLLDTNILSHLVRFPSGPVRDQIAAVGEARVATSIIVAAEMRFGATKKASPRLTAQVEAVLSALPVLPWEAPCDVHYGDIRTALETTGVVIGGNDMLIAAHARALSMTIVTVNTREFARVPGLEVTDWLVP